MKRRAVVGLAVAVTAVSVVTLGACGGGATNPSTSETTTHGTTAESAAGVARCTTSQLQATAVSDASVGPGSALIELSNTGPGKCSLQGYLGVSLPNQGVHILNFDVVHKGPVGSKGFEPSPAATQPAAVVLEPAQPNTARIAMQWHNWCGSTASNLGLKLILRDGGQLPITQQGAITGLTCLSPTAQSVLNEGPVQTPAG